MAAEKDLLKELARLRGQIEILTKLLKSPGSVAANPNQTGQYPTEQGEFGEKAKPAK